MSTAPYPVILKAGDAFVDLSVAGVANSKCIPVGCVGIVHQETDEDGVMLMSIVSDDRQVVRSYVAKAGILKLSI